MLVIGTSSEPRLPEPPTHDLTYTRSVRASTSPRSTGFCVIWDYITSNSSSKVACDSRIEFKKDGLGNPLRVKAENQQGVLNLLK